MKDSKRNLAHVLWLGGMSCSGKTTISKQLSVKHNLNIDHRDDYVVDHFKRAVPAKHPVMFEWKSLMAKGLPKYDLAVRREGDYIGQFHKLMREDFLMTVEDL